jgi:hypothetical protein
MVEDWSKGLCEWTGLGSPWDRFAVYEFVAPAGQTHHHIEMDLKGHGFSRANRNGFKGTGFSP